MSNSSKYNITGPTHGSAIGDGATVHNSREFIRGDKIEMSGDFRGANVNVKSKLEKVTQQIGQLPTADEGQKEVLETLVAELQAILTSIEPQSAEKVEQIETVTETTEALITQASAEKPNKTMITITGEGLKQAAQNLADVAPKVVTIAGQIVTQIQALLG